MQPATTQKAAWDGSPGTSRSKGRSARRPDRHRARLLTAMSAPQSGSSSSVCGRVGTSSRTVVAPSAARPASRTAPLTWALGTGRR